MNLDLFTQSKFMLTSTMILLHKVKWADWGSQRSFWNVPAKLLCYFGTDRQISPFYFILLFFFTCSKYEVAFDIIGLH